MGLDIYFGNLAPTLAAQYSDFPRARTRTERAMEFLLAEIREQTGGVGDLSEAKVPAKYKTQHIRYGSNSAIHTLRVYACRLAGYTLDEAYDLPERAISVLGSSDLEDADEEEESDFELHRDKSGGLTEEQEIERAWQFDLNHVCPIPSKLITPFPFPQLVCFSDAEGIYIPTRFREPIVLDDYFIGSSIQLNKELSEVARQLTKRASTVANEEPNVREFFSILKRLLVALRNPCLVSVHHRFSMIFG
jgi:hypothetical protein